MRWILSLSALFVAASVPANADESDCRFAIAEFESAVRRQGNSLEAYVSCLNQTDGSEDCGSTFSEVSYGQDRIRRWSVNLALSCRR